MCWTLGIHSTGRGLHVAISLTLFFRCSRSARHDNTSGPGLAWICYSSFCLAASCYLVKVTEFGSPGSATITISPVPAGNDDAQSGKSVQSSTKPVQLQRHGLTSCCFRNESCSVAGTVHGDDIFVAGPRQDFAKIGATLKKRWETRDQMIGPRPDDRKELHILNRTL